jgi:spore germination protein KC
LLPRKLFVSQYRALIVSEKMAKEGLLDLVNMIEIQSNGRTSVPLLIAGSPLAQLMKTFTPLESVPADSVSSRLDMLERNSLLVDKNIRVNNLIERMERSEPIVMPIVKLISADSMTKSSDRISYIDANRSNLTSDGGAVIVNYRMVGKLDDDELVWYHLANGGRGRHIKTFQVNGKPTTLVMKPKRIKRSAEWREGRPVVSIDLDIEFITKFTTDNMPKTYEEMKRLENGLAQIVEDEISSFYNKTKAKGWDLLRIRKAAEQNRNVRRHGADALKNVELKVNVKSRIVHTANLNQPY